MEDMVVHYTTNSPHYQSNGFAEKYILLIKNLLFKAHETGANPHFALLLYRNNSLGYCLQYDLPFSHAARMQVGHAACSRPEAEGVWPTS